MRRGSTASLTFTMPFVIESPRALNIDFSQYKYLVLHKELADLELTVDSAGQQSTVVLNLSQEETLRFYKGYANVQARVVFDNGQAFTSDVSTFEVEDSLTNEVIGDGEY